MAHTHTKIAETIASPHARKFLSYYRPHTRLLIADLACALVVAVIALVLPLYVRYITKRLQVAPTQDVLGEIATTGAVMLALVAIYTLCNLFVDYQGHRMGAKIEADMRQELFAHYQKLSFRFYDEQRTGHLMSRITTDLFWIAELCHHGLEDLVISLLTLVGAFIILLRIQVELTLIIFLFLPVMVIFAFHFSKHVNAALAKSKERIAELNAQVEDTVAGMRVVQSFTNEAVEIEKFAHANARFVASRSDGYRSEAYFYGGLIAFTQLITLAVVLLGGVGIAYAALDLADLLTYLLYIGLLIEPIRKAANFATLYQEGITGFHRFMEIIELEPEIQDAAGSRELADVAGHLEFRDVSFKYREEHGYVFRHISLEIKAGETVALVGSSGVGKTTLCSLLPRFYEVSAGTILLDGRDIRTLTLRSLRRNIGMVQQDVYLFAGTVADNIRYGKLDASEAEIIEAAKRANAHAFIMQLPDGYNTDIGQRGVKLSGGQKQRLSIARVFLKDPPVLILDEATSALDSEGEKAVQASLEKLSRNRTTLVIAHRLSTIRKAHRIVVLNGDGIAEQGTHDDLIARNGPYAKLYHLQFDIHTHNGADSAVHAR